MVAGRKTEDFFMKKRGRYTGSLLLLFLLFAMTAAASHSPQPGEAGGQQYAPDEEQILIVYTAHKKEIYEPVIKEFEERTGIWVQVVDGGTNEILERIAKEDGMDSGDVMFGGGVDNLSAYDDYFETYECRQSEVLRSDYYDPDGKWIPFSSLPIVFIYNNKLVYSVGVPRSWEELLDGNWKGKISYAAPDASGSSYTALLTMIQVLEDEGLTQDEILTAFVENLDGNIAPDSVRVLKEVASGTRMIGITNEESAKKQMQKGADLSMVYPVEGTSALPDGTAIIKNCPHRENAELFMEFTVSEETQRFLVEQCNRRSVRTDITQEAIPNEIHYDLERAAESRSEMLEKWAALTGT